MVKQELKKSLFIKIFCLFLKVRFQCIACGEEVNLPVTRGKYDQPKQCPKCNKKHGMELIHNRSSFIDKQWVRLQETPGKHE